MAMTKDGALVHGADTLITNTQTYSVTSGRGLVAMVIWQADAGETLDSITVAGNSNMTLVGTPSILASGWTTQIGYLGAATSGGSKSVVANFSASGPSYMFLQDLHDGAGGGIDLDGYGNNKSEASTNPTVNVTTGTANSAIFAVLEAVDSDPTAGANYTELNKTAWYGFESSEYDLDAGAAGTYAANWTAASGRWSVAAAGFKAAAGGGATLWAQSLM